MTLFVFTFWGLAIHHKHAATNGNMGKTNQLLVANEPPAHSFSNVADQLKEVGKANIMSKETTNLPSLQWRSTCTFWSNCDNCDCRLSFTLTVVVLALLCRNYLGINNYKCYLMNSLSKGSTLVTLCVLAMNFDPVRYNLCGHIVSCVVKIQIYNAHCPKQLAIS